MQEIDNSKPYAITYTRSPDLLHAYVGGEKDSFEISLAYWTEIAAECAEAGVGKLIVEEDIPEDVTYTDMFRIATVIPDLFNNVTIAFVDRYADQIELNEFGELVAQNRGVLGRFFSDIDAAKAWLAER